MMMIVYLNMTALGTRHCICTVLPCCVLFELNDSCSYFGSYSVQMFIQKEFKFPDSLFTSFADPKGRSTMSHPHLEGEDLISHSFRFIYDNLILLTRHESFGGISFW